MTPLLLAIYLTFGADATSTHIDLTRHVAREALYPTQNPWAIDAIIGVETWNTARMLKRWDVEGHHTRARVGGWVAVGVRAAATTQAIRVARAAR